MKRLSWREYVAQVKIHRWRMKHHSYGYAGNADVAIYIALSWHDAEKWLFLPLLYHFHGGAGNRKIARLVYNALNTVGRLISAIVLQGFTPEVKAEARRVERILDCLDRSLDPVARIEMGDWRNPPPLTDFLTGRDLDDALDWMPAARMLVEDHHAHIV